MFDPDTAYQALTSRDTRFDGVFFVGVTSTGIYCRPICPVKPPMKKLSVLQQRGSRRESPFSPLPALSS